MARAKEKWGAWGEMAEKPAQNNGHLWPIFSFVWGVTGDKIITNCWCYLGRAVGSTLVAATIFVMTCVILITTGTLRESTVQVVSLGCFPGRLSFYLFGFEFGSPELA